MSYGRRHLSNMARAEQTRAMHPDRRHATVAIEQVAPLDMRLCPKCQLPNSWAGAWNAPGTCLRCYPLCKGPSASYNHRTQNPDIEETPLITVRKAIDIRRGDILCTTSMDDSVRRRQFLGPSEEYHSSTDNKGNVSQYPLLTAQDLCVSPAFTDKDKPIKETPLSSMGFSRIKRIITVNHNDEVPMTTLHDGSKVTSRHACRFGVASARHVFPPAFADASQKVTTDDHEHFLNTADNPESMFTWVLAEDMPESDTKIEASSLTVTFELVDTTACLCGPYYDFAQFQAEQPVLPLYVPPSSLLQTYLEEAQHA